MQKLGKILNLSPRWSCGLFIKRVSQIDGNIRGKQVTIFSSRSIRSPKRIVVQICLKKRNDVSFCTTKKRLGYSFLRVLLRDIVKSGDPILDRKLIFRCNRPQFAQEVFKYEEICEKFDKLFSKKLNNGILTLGESSIFYYESIGFLTNSRREEFKTAVDLMCDLLDVLKFYNKERDD